MKEQSERIEEKKGRPMLPGSPFGPFALPIVPYIGAFVF
jgi:hypothetical protein